MTSQQKRFVEEYIVDCNGAAAARRAGYSEKTARVKACQLLKDESIKSAIQERLTELAMSSQEALKQISDMARTRLNEFMVVRRVLKTPVVRKPLQRVIDELDAEMEFEEEFCRLAKLGGDDLKGHQVAQKKRELLGIRYALELERNPNAYRDVPGEADWVEEASVDLVALARAKEEGRIKTLSFTEYGPKVEMYPADAALAKILEYHGKLKGAGDNTTNITIFQLPDNGR